MVDQIRFFAGAARMLEGKAAAEYMRGMTSFIRREPVGVCAQVAPWNYPMMMAVWKFAPCAGRWQHSGAQAERHHPRGATATLLAEIAAEFLPAGVFNVITGDRDTGRAMVAHDAPSTASITGSVRAGMEVAEAASHSLKRVHLELGPGPLVVFDDADITAAAEGISTAGFFNAGQDCTAATRCARRAERARRLRRCLDRGCRGGEDRFARRRRRAVRPRQQRQPARVCERLPRSGARSRQGHHGWRASATPGTSSPRPSSTTSIRTTR